jgi:nicotinamide-nucleotide amidase
LRAHQYKMNAAIITIGDEILIGQIVDTNSAWIAENLNLLGIKVDEIVSISDNSKQIKDTLSRYEGNKELIILSGGLGPTTDDLTKDTLAEYFDSELQMNPEVLAHIENLFSQRGLRVSEVNRIQAFLPLKCRILKNPSGTAAGMWFERGGSIFISLPGVPYELKDIYNQSLLPELQKVIHGSVIVHRTLMTQGIPESILSEKIKDWENSLPQNVKLAYLPRPGIVRLRLTAIGKSKNVLNSLLEAEIQKLLKIIQNDVFSLEDVSLERVVGELLADKNLTLATAESCTGGSIANLITSVPGCSRYFKGSIVAYDNSVKEAILNVKRKTIKKYGAVSQQVVEEMADGIRSRLEVDYSIATSGIAGPDGGTKDKPVGTTWIAVSSAEKTDSHQFLFGEHRGRNIEKSSLAALNMLRKMILEIP